MKLKQVHYTITDFSKPSPLLRRLFLMVKATLNEKMSFPYFLKFYLHSKPHRMQITFLQHNGEDVGFFTCTYSFMQLPQGPTVVCRVAIGILETHQKGNMPFASLCRRIMAYKLRHPFRKIFMVAYLANPFVYAAIAKYTAYYWPNRHRPAPAWVIQLKDAILEASNLKKNEIRPFIIFLHFHVALPPSLLERIYNSQDPDVQYYLQINPDFEEQYGVMTIVPVRWVDILANFWKGMVLRPLRKGWRKLPWIAKKIIDLFA